MNDQVNKFQVMPDLTAEEYAALKADIKANGIQVPIIKDQHGDIVDGYHRQRVADELGVDTSGVTVVHEFKNDVEAREYAFKINLVRRHLTRVQLQELIRSEIARDGKASDRQIAKRLGGISHNTVGAVRRPAPELDTPPSTRAPKDPPHFGPVTVTKPEPYNGDPGNRETELARSKVAARMEQLLIKLYNERGVIINAIATAPNIGAISELVGDLAALREGEHGYMWDDLSEKVSEAAYDNALWLADLVDAVYHGDLESKIK